MILDQASDIVHSESSVDFDNPERIYHLVHATLWQDFTRHKLDVNQWGRPAIAKVTIEPSSMPKSS